MTEISVGVLVGGILFGSTIAGLIAHTMNYLADVPRSVQNVILSLHVLTLSVGLSVTYGKIIPITIASIVGIFGTSRLIFNRLTPHMPQGVKFEDPSREILEEDDTRKQTDETNADDRK
jgi:hypothetical protein